MKKTDELNTCIEQIKTDYDRYHYSVFVTIGFREFVNKKKELNLIFVSAERKMKDKDGDNLGEPDIILQYKDNLDGIIIEFKVSSPINPSIFLRSIEEDIDQLKKYDKITLGWDTPSGAIKNYAIVFLVHHEDYKKVKTELIENRIAKKKLMFNHIFSVWEWTPEISTKYAHGDIIIVRDYENGKIGNRLGNYLQNNDIIFDYNEIEKQYDEKKLLFIRREPPTLYLIEQLIFVLLPYISSPFEDIVTVKLTDLISLANQYLPSWISECTQESQIKREWFKKCLNVMKEINIVKKIENEEYTIVLPKKRDLRQEIIKKLAKMKLEKNKPEYRKRQVEKDKKAKILDDFQR